MVGDLLVGVGPFSSLPASLDLFTIASSRMTRFRVSSEVPWTPSVAAESFPTVQHLSRYAVPEK